MTTKIIMPAVGGKIATRITDYRAIKREFPNQPLPNYRMTKSDEMRLILNIYRGNKRINATMPAVRYMTSDIAMNALVKEAHKREQCKNEVVVMKACVISMVTSQGDDEARLKRNLRNDCYKYIRKSYFTGNDEDDAMIKITNDNIERVNTGNLMIRKVRDYNGYYGTVNTVEKVMNVVKKQSEKYHNNFGFDGTNIIGVVFKFETVHNAINQFADMPLSSDIKYLCEYSNVVSQIEGDNSCVERYVRSTKILRDHSDKLKKYVKDGKVTVNDFVQFLEEVKKIKDFTYGIYDHEGKLRHGVDDADVSVIARLNHIHVIVGGKLKRNNTQKAVVTTENTYEIMTEMLNSGIVPFNVICEKNYVKVEKDDPLEFGVNKIGDDEEVTVVRMFETSDKIYINNPEYIKSCNMMTKLGFETKDVDYSIADSMYLGETIGKQYIKSNIKSFCFPYHYMPFVPIYRASDKLIKSADSIVSIDKIGAYRNCLKSLNSLYTFDYAYNKVVDFDGKLKQNCLYCVTFNEYNGEVPNIVMSPTGIYDKEYLEKCAKYGFKYTVTKEIQCEIVPNYFRNMIDEVTAKLPKEDYKDIFNVMIGKMSAQICTSDKVYSKYQHIVTNDEATRIDNTLEVVIDENYKAIRTMGDDKIKLYNQMPIYIQLRNKHNMNMFEDMRELHITKANLIQLRTDNITFNGSITDEFVKSHNYKYEKPNGYANQIEINNNSIINDAFPSKYNFCSMQSVYAGVGKTYLIKQVLDNGKYEDAEKLLAGANSEEIKMFLQSIKQKDYIIFTPQHRMRKMYDEYENNDVITRYAEKGIVPSQKVIIIDEIGMTLTLSVYRLLMGCRLMNKTIVAMGDFNQIGAIGKFEMTTEQRNMLFDCVETNFNENKRNDFTFEYYNDFKTMKPQEAINEMVKHSTAEPEDAEIIIAFRNTTRNVYNRKMLLRFLNKKQKDVTYVCKSKSLEGYKYKAEYEFDELPKDTAICCEKFDLTNEYRYTKGVKYICRTNKFKLSGITNKTELVFDYADKEFIHFENTDFIVKIKHFDANFDYNYVSTINGEQGQTISSYYWCQIDNKVLSIMADCNKYCYTTVSRLKTTKQVNKF